MGAVMPPRGTGSARSENYLIRPRMRARNSSAFWLSGRDRALLPRSPKNRTREFPAYGFLKIVLAEQSFIRLHVAQCCFFPVASYDHFEGITRFE